MSKGLRLLVGLLAICGLAPPGWSADRPRLVKFPPGAAAITLKGTIAGRQDRSYVIQANAGQVLQVLLTPSNKACYFNAFEPGSPEAAHIGSNAGNEFGRSPTHDGVYKLQVYLMRSAARRREACRFSLSIELTGGPALGSPSVSDTLMKDRCRGEAALMYAVSPQRIALARIRKAASGYEIDGTVDKGKEGVKKMRCIFDAQRAFSHIMAMTSDGD